MASSSLRKSVKLPRTCASCGAEWAYTAWDDRHLEPDIVFTRCICHECGFFSDEVVSILQSRFQTHGGSENYIRKNFRHELLRRLVYLVVLASITIALAGLWYSGLLDAVQIESPRGGYAEIALVIACAILALGACVGAIFQFVTLARLLSAIRVFDNRIAGLEEADILWILARMTKSDFNGSFNEDSSLSLLRQFDRDIGVSPSEL